MATLVLRVFISFLLAFVRIRFFDMGQSYGKILTACFEEHSSNSIRGEKLSWDIRETKIRDDQSHITAFRSLD
jgi:hypothetical protein